MIKLGFVMHLAYLHLFFFTKITEIYILIRRQYKSRLIYNDKVAKQLLNLRLLINIYNRSLSLRYFTHNSDLYK